MADETLPELGDLERAVMQLVWSRGTITADTVRQHLDKPLKDSTVRTVLKRLEQKGYVRHTLEGRTFHYSAVEARRAIAARAVQRIVDWFCNGSVDEVLVGMLDSKMLDQKTLKELADKVAKAKAGRK